MNRELLLERIRRGADTGRLAHAFIITGGTVAERARFAAGAAALLLGNDERIAARIADGNCADLLSVRPDGGSIKTEQIAELSMALRGKPFSASRIVALIEDADAMTPQSQNKLLKTLEEPAAGAVLLLLTDNAERLLATVRSRCVTIRLGRSGRVCYEARENGDRRLADAKTVLSIALQHMRPLADMFAVCDAYAGDRAEADGLLDAMEAFLRDMTVGVRAKELIADPDNGEIVAKLTMSADASFRRSIAFVEEARGDIARGMNTKYCLRDMGVKMRQEGLYGKSS
ncbi:MAG: hypothetical protein LBC58_04675 [Clostridiales Family XIII bacterium]|jgi:DNA polymerase-3 subunit delta'|nr:hypothetical protein [Clostridiales Family XIII bacterium]